MANKPTFSFSSLLLRWFKENGRDLPWRNTKDPYEIWLSEIILQQTRVQQGLPYFQAFKRHYPSIDKMAKAAEEDILKLWQGLGYYSRARNMHATAKKIQSEHRGKFPTKYEDIKALKGIGEYTAAAIASFAYDLPYPVIDGNVMRVYSRIIGIDAAIDTVEGKKAVQEAASLHFAPKQAAVFNQAIMDFGALQCVPKQPDCSPCPFRPHCVAFQSDSVHLLPLKSKKTKVKSRYFFYFILEDEQETYIHQRNEKDIWQGLFEFPLLESKEAQEAKKAISSFLKKHQISTKSIQNTRISNAHKHVLSHQILHCHFIHLHFKKLPELPFLKIKQKEFHSYAIPRAIDRYVNASTAS